MRIIVDAMGGDNAPGEIVKGALRARKELGVDVVLVGRKEEIERCLSSDEICQFEIVDAREVVTMEDDPSTATRRKKDSSMTVALNLLRDGKGDAVVSAGSTGALLTGATLIVKRIKGIRRAAMAPVLPAGEHGIMLIDCGANVECTPEYLLQFAYMGSFYAKKMMGCESPRVGLLNVGTEDTKGGELQHQAFALLKQAGEEGRINFVGNVEGTGVFTGAADVVVTDGFTGNVLLKGTEGAINFMMNALKGVFYKSTKNKLAAAVLKNDLKAMKKSMDVNEVGGTAFVGISKPVIKAHGSSKEAAFFSAIRQAVAFVNAGVVEDIENNIEYMKLKAEN
ncbi:MAG: phosphate acyltransferase PlsX [Oscillospiraceae bacterium]|nr:phosphate acyltransferase PlsX [Oscillospiraceae bacterium]